MLVLSRRFVVALALAPQLANAIADGAPSPSLPDVESVFSKAKDKAHDFVSQAKQLQVRVEQEQNKSREALKALKDDYETQLNAQNEETVKMEHVNHALHHQIKEFERENSVVRDNALTIVGANNLMRAALGAMKTKVDIAEQFLKESMNQTDDTKAPELQFLRVSPRPTLEHLLDTAAADAEMSLVQAAAGAVKLQGHGGASPHEQVETLSYILKDILNAGTDGAAKLKATFLQNYHEGEQRQKTLLSEQEALREQRDSANATQVKLNVAKGQVTKTFKDLSKRMYSVRIFARKVDAIATAALKDVLEGENATTEAPIEAPKETSTTVTTTATAAAAPKTQDHKATAQYILKTKQGGHDAKQKYILKAKQGDHDAKQKYILKTKQGDHDAKHNHVAMPAVAKQDAKHNEKSAHATPSKPQVLARSSSKTMTKIVAQLQLDASKPPQHTPARQAAAQHQKAPSGKSGATAKPPALALAPKAKAPASKQALTNKVESPKAKPTAVTQGSKPRVPAQSESRVPSTTAPARSPAAGAAKSTRSPAAGAEKSTTAKPSTADTHEHRSWPGMNILKWR